MDKVHIKSVEPLKEGSSRFVVPHRMIYEQNGVEKVWDLVDSHDSVGAIIYNATSNKLVFVSQFRPPVYRRAQLAKQGFVEGTKGIVLELCEGIVDDESLSLEETMRKEILEETGHAVHGPLEKIATWLDNVGHSGTWRTLFYIEVTNDDKISRGGGCATEGELIDVIELTPQEVKDRLDDPESVDLSVSFAYYWFMANKFNNDN
ncbi:uridine diphosphate glucose pyrophosphatase NUDT14 isoform X2 [Lepeophtheirus salmonis]|uniref:Nudix hydrolase domain-containing protein n=1 Tax=Lepeophtheirus salmonis TaxID=72036 RepID=A0A0K2UAF8_LEPSM|nr:uridine diphosphate glucose pyrophosphatase NUDT14-like isoform X3 [Lepeophtheirus salmonis]